jgi:uncharacterized protein
MIERGKPNNFIKKKGKILRGPFFDNYFRAMKNLHNQTIDTTKLWVERFVIGLNLCPFARHPFRTDKIKYVVFDGDNQEKLTERLVIESNQLLETTPAVLETTLIILPNMLADFEEYLEYLEIAEFIFAELELEGLIQVASFHPDYQFDGTEPMDAENFTNRSPFPILHLLREDSLDRAVEAFPEVGDIPARNIETMKSLGFDHLKKMLNDITGKN